jgi:hypothetical protein
LVRCRGKQHRTDAPAVRLAVRRDPVGAPSAWCATPSISPRRWASPTEQLILTMSVTIIEVAFIVTAIATSTGSSPVARDAVFAVVMIMLNGTIGLCLLLGGWRHREQTYNLPGARAFLSVVIPLAVFALILPNFTARTPGPILSTPQADHHRGSHARHSTSCSSRCRRFAIAASSRIRSKPTAARCPKRRRRRRMPARIQSRFTPWVFC